MREGDIVIIIKNPSNKNLKEGMVGKILSTNNKSYYVGFSYIAETNKNLKKLSPPFNRIVSRDDIRSLTSREKGKLLCEELDGGVNWGWIG